MATYDLAYPGAAIDAILNTAYFLQEAGYIFQGSASEYSGTPSKRVWLIAPAGFTGLGLSSVVPQGSFGICLYNGTAWVGKVINVLTLDSAPTRNSQNGVTSGGVAATLDEIAGGIMETFASLLFDDETAAADLRSKLSYAVKFSVSDVYQTVTHLNILAATTSKAGLMSAEDKAKVDSFLTNLRSLTFADTTASADQATQITETLKATIGGVQEVIDSITLLAATSSKAGLLSASDKAYIDALPATLTSLSNSISGALALMQSLVGYYVCDTAAGTAAKTVEATGYSLTNGGCIRIKMTNANTAANVTLNINYTGAKALFYDGAQASSTNTWEAGEVLEVYYDGTQYQCASGGGGKFATGQKIKDVGIDTQPTRNSNNLVESGGVYDTTPSNVDNFAADLDIIDESQNILARFKNGNFEVKNFKSEEAVPCRDDGINADLTIRDGYGSALVEFKNGHIRTKNFNSADFQTNWQYRYTGEKIDLINSYGYDVSYLFNVTHTITRSIQGCAAYGDYLFVAQDYMYSIAVYQISSGQLISNITFTGNSEYHCNNLCFGKDKYNQSDFSPCLYVSQENANQHKCLVFQVGFDGTAFSLTLVQTITFPTPQAGVYPYFPNAVIDTENSFIYVEGYSTNSYQASAGNKILFLKYNLPLPTAGDVTLDTPLDTTQVDSITATQGCFILHGRLYQAFGGNNTGTIVVRRTEDFQILTTIELQSFDITSEPEAICYCSTDISLLLVTIDKKIHKLNFE